MRSTALLLCLAAARSRGDPDTGARLVARDPAPAAPAPLDPARPAAALALPADDVARRLGAFEWNAAVEWTVTRAGADAERVHVAEHHRIRQLPSGEFEVRADIDPGRGPGSETGRQIVFTGGTTYARALPAAFRARPTDHGRDARRYRDESFGLAASIAALCGDALRFEPAGETTLLGRPARRFRLTLAREAADAATPAAATLAPAPSPAAEPDPDTTRRRAFLEGRVPLAADGELLADAATGAPLRVRLTAVFGVRDAPNVKATVELLAQVKALGAAVSAVTAPVGALPDERKPAGPTSALEAAGLKKRGEQKPGGAEPSDEPE
jgi:hypothetical protein